MTGGPNDSNVFVGENSPPCPMFGQKPMLSLWLAILLMEETLDQLR